MSLHRPLLFLVAPLALLSLFGCNEQGSNVKAGLIDQDQICQVEDWRLDATMATCKPGQKVVFLPRSFGNEQLPVMFAAVNCDLRYSVVLTNGGVTCIYQPIKPAAADSSTKK